MADDFAQVLYREADLLDSGLFNDWLAMLAADLRYWAPVRADLARADERAGDGERLLLFDETRDSLALRIKRLETGVAWSEVPATRTRRFVSNVMTSDNGAGGLSVRSNLMVFRSRGRDDDTLMVGARFDRWHYTDSWRLHERKILIDHRTVENMSLLL